MSQVLAFRPVARTEFIESAAWYESQQIGLGSEFTTEVERAIQTILLQPDRYPIVLGTIRECLLSRFPFCIYYRIKNRSIEVIAVFHSSRDPSLWQLR